MPTKIENRNYAIDFLKFIAVLFITNSHFTPLYKDVNTAFATLGVHGNALFFFISGFTLALNIIIVFGEILIAAYLLRISTNFFLQTLNKLPYNWKNIFNL